MVSQLVNGDAAGVTTPPTEGHAGSKDEPTPMSNKVILQSFTAGHNDLLAANPTPKVHIRNARGRFVGQEGSRSKQSSARAPTLTQGILSGDLSDRLLEMDGYGEIPAKLGGAVGSTGQADHPLQKGKTDSKWLKAPNKAPVTLLSPKRYYYLNKAAE